MEYISDITIVHPEANDYELIYAGGRLLIHGKRINAYDLLNALGFDVELRTCTDESIANRTPTNLCNLDYNVNEE